MCRPSETGSLPRPKLARFHRFSEQISRNGFGRSRLASCFGRNPLMFGLIAFTRNLLPKLVKFFGLSRLRVYSTVDQMFGRPAAVVTSSPCRIFLRNSPTPLRRAGQSSLSEQQRYREGKSIGLDSCLTPVMQSFSLIVKYSRHCTRFGNKDR